MRAIVGAAEDGAYQAGEQTSPARSQDCSIERSRRFVQPQVARRARRGRVAAPPLVDLPRDRPAAWILLLDSSSCASTYTSVASGGNACWRDVLPPPRRSSCSRIRRVGGGRAGFVVLPTTHDSGRRAPVPAWRSASCRFVLPRRHFAPSRAVRASPRHQGDGDDHPHARRRPRRRHCGAVSLITGVVEVASTVLGGRGTDGRQRGDACYAGIGMSHDLNARNSAEMSSFGFGLRKARASRLGDARRRGKDSTFQRVLGPSGRPLVIAGNRRRCRRSLFASARAILSRPRTPDVTVARSAWSVQTGGGGDDDARGYGDCHSRRRSSGWQSIRGALMMYRVAMISAE